MPDYRSGHANTEGNTAQNLFIKSKPGLIAKQDQWLYFINSYALHKVRVDGSGEQTLITFEKPDTPLGHPAPTNLNVIGDWLYLTIDGDIYRVRTDGSRLECLYDQNVPAMQLYVIKNNAYFADENGIHRMDLSTKKIETVNTEIKSWLEVKSTRYQNVYKNLCYLSEEKNALIGFVKTNDRKEIRQYSLSSPDTLQWSITSESSGGSKIFECLIADDTLFYMSQYNIYSANLLKSVPSTSLLFNSQSQVSFLDLLAYSHYKGGLLIARNYSLGTELYYRDGTTALIENSYKPYFFDDGYAYYYYNQLWRANPDFSDPVKLTQ